MRAARVALFAATLIGASSVAVQGQSSGPVRKILVVHADGDYEPAIELFDRGLVAGMRESSADSVDFYIEHLDLQRFSGEDNASMLASHLRHKYEDAGLRAVLAVTDGALAFLRKHQLFQDVPTVAYTQGPPPEDASRAEPQVVRVWAGPTAADTIELALRLHPSTKHVVVLSGKPNNDGAYENEVRAELSAFRGRVDVTFLTDLSLAQTHAALRKLPPDALVLILRLIDTPKANRDSRDSGMLLSHASTVPFYTVKDTRVGYGAVGGYVSDTMAAGFQAAALAVRVALGASPADLPAERVRVVPMFDWRELQRWRIRERDLPAGSQVLFKELSAWDRYRWYILGAISLVSIQAVMMAALIIQRSRQRQIEARNSAILRALPDLMFLQTMDGVYLDYHSPDPGQLLRAPAQFLGKNMRDVLPPALLRTIEPAFAQAVGAVEPVLVEYEMNLADGKHQFEARLVRNNDDQILTLVRDITERKRSADQFRLALEAATTGMLMVSRMGKIVLVNAHIESLFGYRREELINQPPEMLLPDRFRGEHPGDESGFHWDDRAFPIYGSRELYGLRKDGTEIPIEIRLSPLQTSEGEFVLSSIADITERRQAEHEREYLTGHLQELAGRLIAAQEVERARIARDLHDDVSQQLAALSIALSGLKRRVAAMPRGLELQDDISSLQERANVLAGSVRDISHDLHPDVLRHVGLTAALTAYCNGLSQSQALVVTCSAQGDFESIDQEAALCLYRIAQEALHNVVKHSGARRADVNLLRTGDGAEITIADDGKGFDVRKRKSGTGLGLVSITERARLAGGTVTIVTAVNEGTQVRVYVPIPPRTTTDTGDASGAFVRV